MHILITWSSYYSTDSDLVVLGWGLRVYMSNKLPNATAITADTWITLWIAKAQKIILIEASAAVPLLPISISVLAQGCDSDPVISFWSNRTGPCWSASRATEGLCSKATALKMFVLRITLKGGDDSPTRVKRRHAHCPLWKISVHLL